jgi:preprotein translocase subunit YajC
MSFVSIANAAPMGAAAAPGPLVSFFPVIVICGILYLLVIRPQQKQAKEHRQMVDQLKPGDRVLTQGGIYGTIITVKPGSVTVKIADDVKVEIARSAITQVITESANGTPTGKQEQTIA